MAPGAAVYVIGVDTEQLPSCSVARSPAAKFAANDEATSCRWASEADMRELPSEAYAVRVLDALHPERAPAVRAHDGTRLV